MAQVARIQAGGDGFQRVGEQAALPYLVIALDPVNFEKPYTKQLEGVSTVYKKTPPDLEVRARLSRGYPAMTATVVNTPVPAISYANWFSCQSADFLSQNREIQRSIRTTRWVFPDQSLRFVMVGGGELICLLYHHGRGLHRGGHLLRRQHIQIIGLVLRRTSGKGSGQ